MDVLEDHHPKSTFSSRNARLRRTDVGKCKSDQIASVLRLVTSLR